MPAGAALFTSSDPVSDNPICRSLLEALFRTRTGDPILTMEVLYQLS